MSSFITTQFFPIKLHSLFYFLVALIAGITTALFFGNAVFITTIMCSCIIFCLHCTKFITRQMTKFLLIICATFIIGGLNYTHTINRLQTLQQQLITKPFNAVLAINAINEADHPQYKTRITATIQSMQEYSSIATNSPQISCNATLYIFIPEKPDIMVGDIIELHNLTTKKISNEAFERYLFKEGSINTCFCNEFKPISLQRPIWHMDRFFADNRQNLIKKLQKKIPFKSFVLFSSIFLGRQEAIKKPMKQLKQQCKIWGISHYLARSGLHLVIILWVIQLLLRFIPCSFFLKQVIALMVIMSYWLLSWSSISFIRALLTFIFHKFCLLLNVAGHFMYLLTLVCFGVLLHNPLQLFFLDFQLTFGLTFALGWFNQMQQHKKMAT